jgi:hypothetical protein
MVAGTITLLSNHQLISTMRKRSMFRVFDLSAKTQMDKMKPEEPLVAALIRLLASFFSAVAILFRGRHSLHHSTSRLPLFTPLIIYRDLSSALI